MTVAQRRALLRHDPLVQEAEAHRVHCRACQKWIKLAPNIEYAPGNWKAHKQRCPGSPSAPLPVRRTPSKPIFSPSSRVATAERKIVLLNDPQVKVFAPGHVQCGSCKTVVILEGEVDYELTKWTEHKEKCIPSVLLTSYTLGPNLRRQSDPCTDHPTGIQTTRVPTTFHFEHPFPGFRQVGTITHACGRGLEQQFDGDSCGH